MEEKKYSISPNGTPNDKQGHTEDIKDVENLQETLADKMPEKFLKPNLPKGASLIRRTLTRDLATCLVFVYRYYAFHPKAEVGQYYRKQDLFAELQQNVGKDLCSKITKNFTRLKYWDLLVPMPTHPDKVIYKKGWWGITDNGIKFVQKEIGLPKYAEVYNDFAHNHITIPVMISDLINDNELADLLKL